MDFTPFVAAFAVSFVVFIALWPLSLAKRDVGVVDLWWGPGFLAATLAAAAFAVAAPGRAYWVALVLTGVWALRLGAVMIRRHLKADEEDRRYQMMRKRRGDAFPLISLFLVFGLQGVLQFVAALPPVATVALGGGAIGWLMWVGAAVAVFGLGLEAVADWQLDRFKADAEREGLMTSGLRAHVRHPNYTGEIIFWWGMWLIALSAGHWWTVISPIMMTFLLIRVSGAPMLSATLKRAKPGYEAYAARTPAFVPRFLGGSSEVAENAG